MGSRGGPSAPDAGGARPRAGVVVSHPIQYFSPLFDLLQQRGVLDLAVLYGNDAGLRAQWDPGFGVEHQWDLDLVSGHVHEFATLGQHVSRLSSLRGIWRTFRFVRGRDVVVIHGYVGTVAVAAIVCCWILRTPYWLRSDGSVRVPHHRLSPRELWARLVNRRARGALAAGERNAALALSLGASAAPVAPFAVDNDRFRRGRDAAAGSGKRQTVIFGGKLKSAKRPGDVLEVARRLPSVRFLLVGEGPLGQELRATAEAQGLPNVEFHGFANQSEMPDLLATGDVIVLPSEYEPWGLVINEAMAAGAVPVVSEAVGCGPDLVAGLGQVFPTADVDAFTVAVEEALATAGTAGTRDRLWDRVDRFSLRACAGAYEQVLSPAKGFSSHGDRPL